MPVIQLWRLYSLGPSGKEDLACLVNGHPLCNEDCDHQGSLHCNNMVGHCYICEAVLFCSSQEQYKPAKVIPWAYHRGVKK
jgi:hypothetical protein